MSIDSRNYSRTLKTVDTTYEGVNTGPLQRIADAQERMADACDKMAGNYTQLRADREMYERWYKQERASVAKLQRSNNALRGVINRRKRLSESKEGKR